MMSFNTLTRVHCEEEILYYILSESPRRVIYTYMCIHVYVYWLFMEWIKRERKKWWGYWWESECGVYIERKKVSGRNMTETPPELLLMLWKKKDFFFNVCILFNIYWGRKRETRERGENGGESHGNASITREAVGDGTHWHDCHVGVSEAWTVGRDKRGVGFGFLPLLCFALLWAVNCKRESRVSFCCFFGIDRGKEEEEQQQKWVEFSKRNSSGY